MCQIQYIPMVFRNYSVFAAWWHVSLAINIPDKYYACKRIGRGGNSSIADKVTWL
jgi:hypothetical protein